MKEQSSYQKKRQLRPVAISVATYLAAALAILYIIPTHFIFNRSESMPLGIYRITGTPITRASIVGACIPEPYATLVRTRGYVESGRCIGGIRPVMKYVAAIAGDSVEIRLNGLFINGESVPNTRILLIDPLGRAVPHQTGIYVLRPGEFWLLSNHVSGSLDSRYFGPVTKILGVVEPVLTENELCGFSFLHAYLNC